MLGSIKSRPDEAQLAMGSLLQALSQELAEMAGASERLQVILVTACVLAGDRRFFGDAQSCDLLTQKLITLTSYLEAVARVVPKDWTVDAREACLGVNLSELASSLRLVESGRPEPGGELELF